MIHTQKTLFYLLVLLIMVFCFTIGCNVVPIKSIIAYDSKKGSPSQTATIKPGDTTNVCEIDGRSIKSFADPIKRFFGDFDAIDRIFILPGKHEIVLKYRKSNSSSTSPVLVFDAKPGHVYEGKHVVVGYKIITWLEDTADGEVVCSMKEGLSLRQMQYVIWGLKEKAAKKKKEEQAESK